MNKPMIWAGMIVALCLASQLLQPAASEPNGKESPAGEPAESLELQNARPFRALTRSPYEYLLMKSLMSKREQQQLREIEGMVAYAEAAYALAVPKNDQELESNDPFASLRNLADRAEKKLEGGKRQPAGSVNPFELRETAIEAELLRLAAKQASALAGKPQIDRVEWKVDMLSLQLWLLINRLSKQEVPPAAPGR